jgi:hypothetical protein
MGERLQRKAAGRQHGKDNRLGQITIARIVMMTARGRTPNATDEATLSIGFEH